jgi:hypothetical protein
MAMDDGDGVADKSVAPRKTEDLNLDPTLAPVSVDA